MMALFEGIRYFLQLNEVKNDYQIKEMLKKGGAIREFYLSELVTHHISDVPFDDPLSDYISVHSEWVVMSEKCGSLLPTPPFEHKSDQLFSGLVFCTSKLKRSDMEKVHVLVMYYGGKAQRTLNPNVTHLITMETSGAKFERAQKHPDSIKVVTPDWLIDSIDSGKKVEEESYHPSRLQGKPSLTSPTCNGEAVADSNQYKEKADPQFGPQSVAQVQPVHSIHQEQDDKSINHGNEDETVVPSVSVVSSSATSKTPQSNDCHNEQPRRSHETSKFDRIPSKSMLNQQPATTEASTVVSQAQKDSVHSKDTTESSRSLLEGVVIYFTDYQDCMDDDTIEKWKQVVVQHGGRVADSYDQNECTHLLALHKKSDVFVKAFGDGKCVASAHWLNEVLTEQKMFPPKNPLQFPTAFKWQLPDADKYSMSLTNYTENEREVVKDMFRIAGIPFTGHLTKENTHLICKRPEGKKYEKALEWGVPVVNGTFLAEIIHNGQVPVVLYPRHTNLGQPDEFSPGSCFEAVRLLKPWEVFMTLYTQRRPNFVDNVSTQSAFHTLTSVTPSQSLSHAPSTKRTREESGGLENETTTKKLKLADGAESAGDHQDRLPPTVLFTGLSQSLVKKLKKVIVKLGGHVTDSGRGCTHVVSSRVTRTVKFLSGISVCQHIVTPDWVEKCGKEERFVEEGTFTLTDSDAEQMFQMDVASSLARAKQRKLLEGLSIYATPSVQPPFSNLKEIVECAGGTILTVADLKSKKDTLLQSDKFVVISSLEDIAGNHCLEFFKNNIGVYNAEFVLTGVLRQQLDYKQNKLLPAV